MHEHHHKHHEVSDVSQAPGKDKGHQIYAVPLAILLSAILISGSIFYSANRLSTLGLKGASTAALPGNGAQGSLAGQQQILPSDSGPIQVSIDDDPVLGRDDAPVTIIEFSDFQCPFCRSFWRDTLPELKKDYIDTGKVKFVYRDFPLTGIHPGAVPAAEAAQCASEQGKFWELHDKIFSEQDKQGQGTIQFTAGDVEGWAEGLGLNQTSLGQCLDSGKYTGEVQKDLADGQAAGVNGTPTIFIGKTTSDGTITATKVVGAQPYSVFKTIIDEQLK